ncbi:hypothetical protein BJX70DRAFT_393171 [Aspergillus crustosus]
MPLNSALPNGTLKVEGSTVAAIKKHIELQLQLPTTTCYIHFTNIPPAIGARDLVVKLVDEPHEVAHYAFTKTILEQTCAMNLKRARTCLQRCPILSLDSPWTLPPGRSRQWPAVVAQCGYSESTRHLRAIADLWISNFDGDVKVALIISIERGKDRMIVRKWVPGQTARSTGPSLRSRGQHARREQELVITKGQDGSAEISGASLVIGFKEMFLRPLVPPTEHDFVIDAAELEDIARQIWRAVENVSAQ